MTGFQRYPIWLLSLSIFTILFFNFYERYAAVGSVLLSNTSLTSPLSKWHQSKTGNITSSNGILRLHSKEYGTDTYITRSLPVESHHKLLQLSIEAKTRQVSRGDKKWMSARVILLSHNQDGTPIYSIPHNLVNLSGSHDWSKYTRVFKIPETSSKISVSIQLANVTGSFWVKNVSLQAVSGKPSFNLIRMLFIGLWLATLSGAALFIIRLVHNRRCYQIMLLTGITIIIGTLLPAYLKDSLSQLIFGTSPISATTASNLFSFQVIPAYYAFDIYKTGHFILFFLISVISLHCRPKNLPYQYIIYLLFIFALTTEVLQLFIEGRNPGLRDLLIDFAGILFGLLLYLIKRSIFNRT